MNKEYLYINDKVVVSNDDGTLTTRNNTNNIVEILNEENKIEGLRDDIKYSEGQILYGEVLKSKIKKYGWLFVAIWPALFLSLYPIADPVTRTIGEFIKSGVIYSTLSAGVAIYLSAAVTKEQKRLYKLLKTQRFELHNSKQQLDKLTINNQKTNTKEDKEIHELNLQQLKEYRAKIVAEHYFDQNKDKIIKLVNNGKLRIKFSIDTNDNYDDVYDELEKIVTKNKTKTLKK
ncbi:MAG: hypothetical protein PHI05_02780 [Bacilli bacterium]|nr:hypothetical protein [Bacilli bacterium]